LLSEGLRPGPGRRVRVLAVEGEPLYRDAVTRAIRERPELELVAATGDGREALEAIGSARPDVAIVSGTLDGVTGQQLLNAVERDGMRTRVVMMAARPEPRQVYGALADGAAGYLTRDADARELCDAITAVARGATVLSRELQGGVADEIRQRTPKTRPLMTEREHETLRLIAAGLSAPAIGNTLHLSTATVKTHLQHIYAKLGVSERAAAVAEAMRRGLLE
jgi:two-component system, NarL family, nitrate/nitrite response regulator NarL